jgi:hypothetical protein
MSSELAVGIIGALVGGLLSLCGSLLAMSIAEERRAASDDHAVLVQIYDLLSGLARRSLKPGEPKFQLTTEPKRAQDGYHAALKLLSRLRSRRGMRLTKYIRIDCFYAGPIVELQDVCSNLCNPETLEHDGEHTSRWRGI